MQFASADHVGKPIVVARSGDGLVDATPLLGDAVAEEPMIALVRLLAEGAIDASALSGLPALQESEVTITPLVRRPGKIIAAPINYDDHKAEMKQLGDVSALGFFLKSPSSVLADGGTVILPYSDRRFDQEGELAVVIGKGGKNIAERDVARHIAGYTCLLDITMRGGEDRSTRKSFDTFTPVGPYLVTADEVGDLATMTLESRVNGTLRQDADIAELIWGVERFISYVSSVTTLEPGDIITTGTPAGVGSIDDGDRVEVTISNVGTLSVAVSAQGAVLSPTKGAQVGPKPPETVTPLRQRTADGRLTKL